MTAKQYLKLHPEQYLMVTHEFGTPIYISEATTKGMFDIGVTEKKDEAIKWSSMDNTPAKIGWHSAKTGYKALTFELLG